jgi:hypothetical protein
MIRTSARMTAALAVVIGLAAGTASAKERPFRLRGTATWDNILNAFDPTVGATFNGKAQVTHLRKVRQTGILFLSPVPNEDGLLPGFGSVTLTAANGDRLTFEYNGLLDPATGLGTGTLTFSGGTGRFADAVGEGVFTANLNFSEGFIGTPMAVTIRGTIDY